MRIGTIQVHNHPQDTTRNLAWMLDYVQQGIELKLDLLCFPELALTGYPVTPPSPEALNRLSEPSNGPSAQKLMEAINGTGLVLAYGFLEQCGSKPYNSYNFVGANGVLHTYRKTHLADCGTHHERDLFRVGEEIPVFDLGQVTCGTVICWDGFFTETTRILTLKGAELIVWPLAGFGDGYYTRTVAPVRAIDNGVHLVVSAVSGQSDKFHFDGGAGIFDRAGRPLTLAGKDTQELVWAEVDISSKKTGHQKRLLSERRPELYGPLRES